MRRRIVAGTASAVLLGLGVSGAGAEIRTDRLSGGRLKAWKRIVALVLAVDHDGRPLRPTLYRLWHEVDASEHVVQIELVRPRGGASAIAGCFWIETMDPHGRFQARVRLNLQTIDTASPELQAVPFDGLSRAERRAQVLGHELAHAAWALAEPTRARLVVGVQVDAERLARRSVDAGTAGPVFARQAQDGERMEQMLEEPAVAAEAAVAAELRTSRRRRGGP
jgi:hypothetical protein